VKTSENVIAYRTMKPLVM